MYVFYIATKTFLTLKVDTLLKNGANPNEQVPLLKKYFVLIKIFYF